MCGCAGSTPQQVRNVVHNGPAIPAGGPGTPGYTWDGPAQAPEPQAQPAQPAQK